MPVAFDFNPLAPRGARLMSMRTPMASPTHFNPLAPRGARPGQQTRRAAVHHFNPLAPRGARRDKTEQENKGNRFQSTRPSRGETGLYRIVGMPSSISIHSPLAGRDAAAALRQHRRQHFNPLAPRGARPSPGRWGGAAFYFNPLAPRGARRVANIPIGNTKNISIHSPLAGRDVVGDSPLIMHK